MALTDVQCLGCISIADMEVNGVVGYKFCCSLGFVVIEDQVAGQRMSAIGTNEKGTSSGCVVFKVCRDCLAIVGVGDVVE